MTKSPLILCGIVATLGHSTARAADGYEVLHWGNISELGAHTEAASADFTAPGRAPVNDEWVYVYDPNFYFFLTGSDTGHDRTAEFADKGYVVVAAAGNPGGLFTTQPSWFSFDGFEASFDASAPETELAITYQASWVPTLRGFQSFIVYRNFEQVSEPDALTVYDSDRFQWPLWHSGHRFGADAVLLTGDGPEQHTTVDTFSETAAFGPSAIEIRSDADGGTGSHWKYMLFANGSAAAHDGIDLTGYTSLEFYARASQPVTLLGGFGSGDDSAQRGLPAMALDTEYQKFEFSLEGMDLSDVNTLLWVYLHRDVNGPGFDFGGVSVFLDNIRLVKADTFATESTHYKLGTVVTDDGSQAYREVLYDRAVSHVSILGDGSLWVIDRAIMHNQRGRLRHGSLEVVGFYVKDCFSGEWVDASQTVYGPANALTVGTYSGQYDVHHGYANIVSHGFVDPQFECVTDATPTDEIVRDGVRTEIPVRGIVDFALVVEHR
jgi:hypothetical protein